MAWSHQLLKGSHLVPAQNLQGVPSLLVDLDALTGH
jgi:hypothetical protein